RKKSSCLTPAKWKLRFAGSKSDPRSRAWMTFTRSCQSASTPARPMWPPAMTSTNHDHRFSGAFTGSSFDRPRAAKTPRPLLVRRPQPRAHGTAELQSLIAKAAATDYPVFQVRHQQPAFQVIGQLAAGVLGIGVQTPFADVAQSVEQAEVIGHVPTH